MTAMNISTSQFSSTLRNGILCLAVAVILLPPSNCTAGNYLSSAHGDTTSGVQRDSMTSYAVGNCAQCHEQHASVAGDEPDPDTGDNLGPGTYLAAGTEEDLCLHCHGEGGNTTNPDDITTDIEKDYGHGPLTTASVMATAGNHRANEKSVTATSTSPHIECTDCHNPHLATTVTRTEGSNAITTNSPIQGVTGIDFDTFPTWSSSGTPNSGGYSTATKEYQICFKCHSSANTSLTGWNTSLSISGTSEAWTDVAMEFNPDNNAYHPIVAALPSDRQLQTDQLVNGWSPGDTMYCSDCHAGTLKVGPHGSAFKWMLAGTNKAWPFASASDNGKDTGTYRILYSSTIGMVANNGTDDGLFCLNCHPIDCYIGGPPPDRDGTYAASDDRTNRVHIVSPHNGYPCVACHIRVPHGGKVSRFIAADNVSTAAEITIPDRYWADGEGGLYSIESLRMKAFERVANPSDYASWNCFTPPYESTSCIGGSPNHGSFTIDDNFEYWSK